MAKILLYFGITLSYLFFSIPMTATGQQRGIISLSLDEAIGIALQNNRDVLIARENLNKAEQQVRETRSTALPSLKFESFVTRTIQKPAFFLAFGGEVQKIEIGTDNAIQSTLTLEQLLYSGGQVRTAINIAKSYSDSFKELILQTEKNVKLQVRQQYLGILLSREIVRVTKRNHELADAHFNQVKTLHSRGAASDFDVLRAEVRVANVLPGVISAENDLVLQIDVLKNLLGLPLTSELDIRGELSPHFIEDSFIQEIEGYAYRNRNDYRNLQNMRDAIEGRIIIERASWLPELKVNYNYQFQAQSNTFSFGPTDRVFSQNASLNLSVPIFDGFRTAARVQQAEIEVKEMDYQILKLKETIDIQITRARNKMDDARKRIEALSQTVVQAQKAYDIALVRYNSGQGIQLELFDAQVALEMTELNTLQSIFDYETAKAEWDNAVGQ